MGMYDRDHPRVCGEKSVCRAKFCADGGITPAYAGKRGGKNCIEKPLGDHPRVCGEKGIQGTVGSFSQGSPPRMRGKVQHPAP